MAERELSKVRWLISYIKISNLHLTEILHKGNAKGGRIEKTHRNSRESTKRK
jgi:hypothetical protein